MRSINSSARRRHRDPHHAFLPAVARLVDLAGRADPGHVLVHVDGPVHPAVELAFLSVDRELHPFAVLAGVTAPDSWTAFGIRARGRARPLDQPAVPPVTSAATFLADRGGAEASVLRLGEAVSEPPGPAVGTVPDLVRRVLDLPTAPAPVSTALLWTSIWLDRVLERWAQPHRRRDLTSSWGQVAVLHPAIHAPSPPDVVAFADPAALVSVARSHAAAASWAQLRRSPVPLALPDGPLPPSVARWMDDGFFARWTTAAFPPVATTARELRALLGEPLGPQLLATTVALLDEEPTTQATAVSPRSP
jgi:hypothetical protein